MEASIARDWRLRPPEARRRRLRAWLWTVALLTAAVLVVGGITRLTRSGLSIVEWQPVIGAVPPLTEGEWAARFRHYQEFPEYRQLRQGMTLAEFKVIFFWEYLHRLLARTIGVVFLVPFVAFWRAGDLPAPLARRTLTVLALGVSQGAMGWWMVRSGLVDRPSVSHYRLAAHLSLAFVIFACTIWLARELAVTPERARVARPVRTLMSRGLRVLGGLLAAQIVWGAFVAGLKAGLSFNTFPLMVGRVLPVQLFALEPAASNFVQNPVAVQWMHRLLGTVLVLACAAFFVRVWRAGVDRRSAILNRILAASIAAQYAVGVLTLVLAVPAAVAALHQATALAIVGVWVTWLHHVRNLDTA